MKSILVALATLGLVTPVLSQGLPALEGDGSQTQRLDLLGGSVSVSVESAGSMSLGRSDDNVNGSLTLNVNDVTLTTGGSGTGNDISAPSPDRPFPVPGRSDDATAPSLRAAPASDDVPTCIAGSATPADLAEALAQHLDILLRPTNCAEPDLQLAALIAAQPQFIASLERAGIDPDALISITINDEAVIVTHSSDD